MAEVRRLPRPAARHYSARVHSARERSERSRPLVVFDFDGTLADTWRDIASALNRTLDEAGLAPVEGPDVRFWIGDGVKPLLRKAIPELRDDASLEELYARFSEHYRACLLDTTREYPGIVACLDALEDALLVVASNKPQQFLDRIVSGLGLAPRFRLVLGGDSLAVRKPDPVVITAIAQRLGQPTSEVWMVGDSAIDVNTGRAAGARTIGCSWGLRGRDELERAGADFLIESPAEIPGLVFPGRVFPERRAP
jgi:phosphoglycolate phosphatase